MGQAAVDLPDPLEPPAVNDEAHASPTATAAPPPPSPMAGADDLLAQLAGEEIDRLLAEADSDARREPTAPGSTSASPTARADEAARVSEALDAAAPTPATVAAAAPEAPSEGVRMSDVLNAAAATATPAVDPAPALGSSLDTAEQELASLASGQAAPAPVATTIAELHTTADESAALLDDSAVSVNLAQVAREVGDDGNAPALVRMLEWVNAPFASLPDGARDTIGKIAILTLFNSVAVLAYVLLFRSRH
jgi:hypothetical protein